MSTVTLEEAMDVIDGLLSYAGWPLAKYQKEWDEQSARAGKLLERYRQPPTPQSGPISDSASGVASDSGGVDLSGVQKGRTAESVGIGVVTCISRTIGYVRWITDDGAKYETFTNGMASNNRWSVDAEGRDAHDIIRLLPENGGGI